MNLHAFRDELQKIAAEGGLDKLSFPALAGMAGLGKQTAKATAVAARSPGGVRPLFGAAKVAPKPAAPMVPRLTPGAAQQSLFKPVAQQGAEYASSARAIGIPTMGV